MDSPDAWWRVTPPRPLNGDLAQVLASVDTLQRAWADVVRDEPEAEFREARQRNLRRHAIETGIIERLYDVDWGVTEALVAEGLTAEVAAREGGIDDAALTTIRSQFEALTFLTEAAGSGQRLSVSFIRQLHAALCRDQTSYEGIDQFGRKVQLPLRLGSWKESPNQAHLRDGTVLEFAPPDHVASEMDRLVDLFESSEGVHPVTLAAWLHHAFVAVHPFDDGNGRVARALCLLVLLRCRFAPLVVDRFSRADYLAALEVANTGDLRELVRLFARLEMVALRAELERPQVPAEVGTGVVDIARAYAERLRLLRAEQSGGTADRSAALAREVQGHLRGRLEAIGRELAAQFVIVDPEAASSVFAAAPPAPESLWWRAQIVRAAREADFYSNLAGGTWWTHLRLTVLGHQLRFVPVVQKVGHGETGVLALTVIAETVPPAQEGTDRPSFVALLGPGDTDSVTLVGGEDLSARLPEIDGTVETALAVALDRFAKNLG